MLFFLFSVIYRLHNNTRLKSFLHSRRTIELYKNSHTHADYSYNLSGTTVGFFSIVPVVCSNIQYTYTYRITGFGWKIINIITDVKKFVLEFLQRFIINSCPDSIRLAAERKKKKKHKGLAGNSV